MGERTAIVVLSGGQDSTTCLYWARQRFRNIETLTFDYGQRHRIEIDCARRIAELAGVANTVLPLDTLSVLGGNSLTDSSMDVRTDDARGSGLPNSFVPGRNLLFLTIAAAYAWQHDSQDIVTGVAQTDYSGYPDCRRETIEALQRCLRLGMESRVHIHTPLMDLDKKATVLLASSLGALDALALTHTCYYGARPPCGTCPACVLRAKGFAEAGIPDPLLAA